MKAAIETARLRTRRTADLAADARYAQERYDLYKAKTYGSSMTSPAKLRELERARDLSDARLRMAWVAPGSGGEDAEIVDSSSDLEEV